MLGLLNPYALLAALATAIGCVAGGYRWGAHATDNAWQARAARTERAARDALQKETGRADQAAAAHLRKHREQEDRYAQLQSRLDDLRRSVPLVVPRPVVSPARCPAGADAAVVAPAPAALQAAAPHEDASPPELSLAAVRLWNAALAGDDAPAAACGADAAPEEARAACAQGAGLTVDDAWRSHERNARGCAADRARYQALIDFLSEGK